MLRFCEPDWIRTNDLLLRRQLLYPAELPIRFPNFPYIYRFIWECKSSENSLYKTNFCHSKFKKNYGR